HRSHQRPADDVPGQALRAARRLQLRLRLRHARVRLLCPRHDGQSQLRGPDVLERPLRMVDGVVQAARLLLNSRPGAPPAPRYFPAAGDPSRRTYTTPVVRPTAMCRLSADTAMRPM